MRIVVVEDNLALADGIARAFQSDGHGVDQIHDGDTASTFLAGEDIDLVILDINLPGKSGLEVLKDLRARSKSTPVLMLTARGEIDDKICGLDHGADDYMTKPFDLAELQARARALLRRSDREIVSTLTLGDVQLDLGARQLQVAGAVLDLPRREIALAEVLMKRREQVISKEQIIEHLYGAGAEVDDGAVELYVHRLRKRLARSNVEIKTLRGLGYTLRLRA